MRLLNGKRFSFPASVSKNKLLLSVRFCTVAFLSTGWLHAQSIYTPYTFTTFAGLAGASGSANGTNSTARFHSPTGVATDLSGNVYVTDSNNHTIRKITPAGVYVGDELNNTIRKGASPFSISKSNANARLTIVALMGSTNTIQYVNDVTSTNWVTLTNLTLPTNPYIFIDYGSSVQTQRFYRDLLVP